MMKGASFHMRNYFLFTVVLVLATVRVSEQTRWSLANAHVISTKASFNLLHKGQNADRLVNNTGLSGFPECPIRHTPNDCDQISHGMFPYVSTPIHLAEDLDLWGLVGFDHAFFTSIVGQSSAHKDETTWRYLRSLALHYLYIKKGPDMLHNTLDWRILGDIELMERFQRLVPYYTDLAKKSPNTARADLVAVTGICEDLSTAHQPVGVTTPTLIQIPPPAHAFGDQPVGVTFQNVVPNSSEDGTSSRDIKQARINAYGHIGDGLRLDLLDLMLQKSKEMNKLTSHKFIGIAKRCCGMS